MIPLAEIQPPGETAALLSDLLGIATMESLPHSFINAPVPVWIFHQDTLKFLEVNQAAVDCYGYARADFLKMSILDIRPSADVPLLLRKALHPAVCGPSTRERWTHRHKNGSLFDVEINSFQMEFRGHRAELVLAIPLQDRDRCPLLDSRPWAAGLP